MPPPPSASRSHEPAVGRRPGVCRPRHPVYPVHWPHPAGGATLMCSCRHGPSCDRPAKHPLVRHGVKDATTDPQVIGRWWHRWPQANLGLATGIVFDALDVDGPVGLAALRQLAPTVGLRLPGSPGGHGGRWLARLVSPRPGWATAHPAAWPTSTGAAAAAACSPHPAGMSPAAATRGCAAWTGRRYPRSPPPCASCMIPAGHPPPGQPAPGLAGHGRSPVRPPGAGRRAGRPRPGRPRTAGTSTPTHGRPSTVALTGTTATADGLHRPRSGTDQRFRWSADWNA
jgi:Bifunctional DNA primase/polymerase, N-terminal